MKKVLSINSSKKKTYEKFSLQQEPLIRNLIWSKAVINVLILCLCTRERVEIMLQFQILGVVSDRKLNLVGASGRSFFEFRNSFQKRREKPKKN
ncbi:Uncharacterized protein FWK35_00021272 [Aphis craccivora]|uniref:Uncharacterized protein n=1 Tax=Aphis craccivora TaxID=307492 RepID=A0A6G0YD45_APHCR|nr:Uncharacterized protein FWK35_00021272 [Aphis craccivora]